MIKDLSREALEDLVRRQSKALEIAEGMIQALTVRIEELDPNAWPSAPLVPKRSIRLPTQQKGADWARGSFGMGRG